MDRLGHHMQFVYVAKPLTKASIGLETPHIPSHQHNQESTCTSHLMLYNRAANGLHQTDQKDLNQATKICKKVALK